MIPTAVAQKISMFCHVGIEQVVAVHDVSSLYHVPLLLNDQGLMRYLQKRLKLAEILTEEKHLAKGNKLMTMWKELTVR